MAFLKLLCVAGLIMAMTFHSIAPAHAWSNVNNTWQVAMIQAANNWCDEKLHAISTPLHTVQYCRIIQEKFNSACMSGNSCDEILLSGHAQDVIELNEHIATYLVTHSQSIRP